MFVFYWYLKISINYIVFKYFSDILFLSSFTYYHTWIL
ncbi:putative membrane protein [Acinetobacter baumannii 1391434]|nr:putative membrane protein [Acinetobacter baumannii 1391434]